MQLTIITLIKDRKWYLSLVAFISGAVVMALEFVTSRILTPIFGSSIYAWGSLIGIVLTGSSWFMPSCQIIKNSPKMSEYT